MPPSAVLGIPVQSIAQLTKPMNQIQIPSNLPPAPFVLCDEKFVGTLSGYEKRISEIKIVDAATAQIAADLQTHITRAGKDLDATRKELLRPVLDLQNAINDAARPVLTRIDLAKKVLSDGLSAYAQEQKRLADEAERVRQAELRRLETLRLAEEKKARELAEAERKAEEARLAALSEAERARVAAELAEMDFPPEELEPAPKTETERAIEAVKFAPATVQAAPVGVSFKETLVIDTVDVNKLPDIFVTRVAKESALRAAFCVGWSAGQAMPVCEGVTFKIDRKAVSTGRAKF